MAMAMALGLQTPAAGLKRTFGRLRSPGDAAGGPPRPAGAPPATAGAVAADWKSLVDGSEQLDWFDQRNPEYIRRTLPTFKAYSSLYHRCEVHGLDNIP